MRHPINKAVVVQAKRATHRKDKQAGGGRHAGRGRRGRRNSSRLRTHPSLRFSSTVAGRAARYILGFIGRVVLVILRAEFVQAIRPHIQSLIEAVMQMQ